MRATHLFVEEAHEERLGDLDAALAREGDELVEVDRL